MRSEEASWGTRCAEAQQGAVSCGWAAQLFGVLPATLSASSVTEPALLDAAAERGAAALDSTGGHSDRTAEIGDTAADADAGVTVAGGTVVMVRRQRRPRTVCETCRWLARRLLGRMGHSHQPVPRESAAADGFLRWAPCEPAAAGAPQIRMSCTPSGGMGSPPDRTSQVGHVNYLADKGVDGKSLIRPSALSGVASRVYAAEPDHRPIQVSSYPFGRLRVASPGRTLEWPSRWAWMGVAGLTPCHPHPPAQAQVDGPTPQAGAGLSPCRVP